MPGVQGSDEAMPSIFGDFQGDPFASQSHVTSTTRKTMNDYPPLNRRNFLKETALAGAALGLAPG